MPEDKDDEFWFEAEDELAAIQAILELLEPWGIDDREDECTSH